MSNFPRFHKDVQAAVDKWPRGLSKVIESCILSDLENRDNGFCERVDVELELPELQEIALPWFLTKQAD